MGDWLALRTREGVFAALAVSLPVSLLCLDTMGVQCDKGLRLKPSSFSLAAIAAARGGRGGWWCRRLQQSSSSSS